MTFRQVEVVLEITTDAFDMSQEFGTCTYNEEINIKMPDVWLTVHRNSVWIKKTN